MKHKKYFCLFLIIIFGTCIQAQSREWTLDECISYAIENNISIIQTELDYKSALIEKKDAKGNFLPKVNANANHSWNVGLNQDITTGIYKNQTNQYTSTGANVEVDIYKGLQNQNILRKAKLSILLAKYKVSKMQEDIALNVTNSFLEVLFNKEDLLVKKEQLAINEKLYKRSEELSKAGSIPGGDLLDIKATIASNRHDINLAENVLIISKMSLAQLLQLENFKDFDIIDEQAIKLEDNLLDKSPEFIYNQSKNSKIELKIAATDLEIAQKNLSITRGKFVPTLTAYYNINTRISYADVIKVTDLSIINQAADPFFTQFNNNRGQSFGLQLTIPVLNGFSVKNDVERSRLDIERAKITIEQENLELEQNVYTAFTDAKGSASAYDSSIEVLASRQKAFDYSKEKYILGMMNSFDFSQSQTLLINAKSDVLRNKYDYIFKVKVLEYYFGIPLIKK